MNHLHHDESPASDLNHLHQPCITCINPCIIRISPASRAKGCIRPASAAHGPLHHAHQGTRKTQAPSTKHASNAKPPLCPLPATPPKPPLSLSVAAISRAIAAVSRSIAAISRFALYRCGEQVKRTHRRSGLMWWLISSAPGEPQPQLETPPAIAVLLAQYRLL